MTLKSNTYLPYHRFQEDNRQVKLEGRYWNPENQNICVVASITKEIDWAAYIGACPGAGCEKDALSYVVDRGTKLSEKDARYFFPEINLSYRA